jgi:uncharacterized membrane protein
MLATIVWLGGLATISLWLMPSMRVALSANAYADWIAKLNNRMNALGWLSIAILIATGLVQMSANINYEGLFSIANNWALALLLKHIVFFGMIAISAYITWALTPKLQHAALLRARDGSSGQEQILLKRFQRLMALDLILGIITLAFTAFARIS